VMIFDTWGGLLSADAYATFSLAYIERVLQRLRAAGSSVPTIVFTKGGGQWLERIAGCGCSAVGLDWTTDMAAARARVGSRVALQGNLDPQVLLSTPAAVEREAGAILRAAGPEPGFIFNLGHGIVPETPPEHVAALVSYVHAVSDRQPERGKNRAEGKSLETRVEPRSTGA
jgi:uroporphyrinogen decarboxylase